MQEFLFLIIPYSFANLISMENRNDQEQIHSLMHFTSRTYYGTMEHMFLKSQKELSSTPDTVSMRKAWLYGICGRTQH